MAQHFDFIGAFGNTGIQKSLHIKRIQASFLHQLLKASEVERDKVQAIDIFKATLGQAALHRGLTAFEAALATRSAAGLVAFMAACGRTAVSGACTASDAFTRFDGALGRAKITEFHYIVVFAMNVTS